MRYSIVCGEDAAFVTPQRLQASLQVLEPEIRQAVLAELQQEYEARQFWGVQPVPSVQKQPDASCLQSLGSPLFK